MTEGTPKPELTRYVVSFEGRMFPSETGPWLYRDDVLATIDSLRSENATLRKEVENQKKLRAIDHGIEADDHKKYLKLRAERDQLRAELAALRGKRGTCDCGTMPLVEGQTNCNRCGRPVELTNKEG